jgi:hypothetical protein
MSLSAAPSTTLQRERPRPLGALQVPPPVPRAEADGHSDRCSADWRRADGYWACVRRAGHRGRHRMRSTSRAA